MDTNQLSQQVTELITPFLPFLVAADENASEEAAERIGSQSWQRAKAVWAKLHPAVRAKPTALTAVQDAATDPDDATCATDVQNQIRLLLTENTALADELTAVLARGQIHGPTGTQSDDLSLAADGTVAGEAVNLGS